jgi:hypothetical protein
MWTSECEADDSNHRDSAGVPSVAHSLRPPPTFLAGLTGEPPSTLQQVLHTGTFLRPFGYAV